MNACKCTCVNVLLSTIALACGAMAAAPQPERTPRGQGELLRGRLIDAAEAIVAERGDPAHATIRAVTRRAGVSPTAFYLHFASREELLTALRARGFEEFRACLAAGVAAAGPEPFDRLHGAGRAYLRFARERPNVYGLIFPRHEPDDRVGLASFEDLKGLVAACAAQAGAVDADVETLAVGIWSGIHGYAMLSRAGGNVRWPDDDEFAGLLARAWLGAAR